MKIFDKINFREPKYMLPAVLYIPLLVASYFIFDLFQTETAEIPDKTLQTTEFLNPDLPDARLKGGDGIGSKYENMAKSWGKIQDYSAVDCKYSLKSGPVSHSKMGHPRERTKLIK